MKKCVNMILTENVKKWKPERTVMQSVFFMDIFSKDKENVKVDSAAKQVFTAVFLLTEKERQRL